jgi:hypothetical protein
MSAFVGMFARHDDFVAEPRRDLVVAAGTAVRLHGLVGMHMAHVEGTVVRMGWAHYPKSAHSTSAATTSSAAATTTASVRRDTRERNGLSPIPVR